MPIELTIRITSPLTPDDRDLLSGVAVMTLAIANREITQGGEPAASPDDEEAKQETAPAPCGCVDPANRDLMCISPVGHRGRHRFRAFVADGDGSIPRAN